MTIDVKLNLPESVVDKAREKGLLDPVRLALLIERELDLDKPVREFREMVKQLRACKDEPMTMDEIQEIVNEVRAEQRALRENRR
jgi:hypothetical protein